MAPAPSKCRVYFVETLRFYVGAGEIKFLFVLFVSSVSFEDKKYCSESLKIIVLFLGVNKRTSLSLEMFKLVFDIQMQAKVCAVFPMPVAMFNFLLIYFDMKLVLRNEIFAHCGSI